MEDFLGMRATKDQSALISFPIQSYKGRTLLVFNMHPARNHHLYFNGLSNSGSYFSTEVNIDFSAVFQ